MTEPDDTTLDYEWGGDGSDLHRPVQAHVEAALVPTGSAYAPPLDQLLKLGDPREVDNVPALLVPLGLTEAHVPELVRMTRDRALNTADSESDEVWAPIYALEALKQFDVSEHIAALVPLFDLDSDWFGEELPTVLSGAGAAALEPLRAYIQDRNRWIYGRWQAASVLPKLVERSPELRAQVVQILSDTLAQGRRDETEVNGGIVSELLHLNALEALPTIRSAYEGRLVEESIPGDWGAVLEALGQVPDPRDSLVRQSRLRAQTVRKQMSQALAGTGRVAQSGGLHKGAGNKQKSKRKQSEASRKANRKRRK